MHLLGIPTYVVLLLLIWTFPYGKPFIGFVLATAGALAYQFLYCKSLYFFVHQLKPQRPVWQFFGVVLATQFLAIGVLYAAA